MSTGEWQAVYDALPGRDEGWATARAVADVPGLGLSASIVTRRLHALESGGRVESCTDRRVTGLRGRAWRRRTGPRQPVVGMIVVDLPAGDVGAGS